MFCSDFCFFMHKPAYEMRISDWSSDVCSSDLMPELSVDDTGIVAAMAAICDAFEAYGYRRVGAALRHQGIVVNNKKIRRLMREHGLQPKVRRRYVARKSVVSGKRVSRRVEPSGSRTSKNKKQSQAPINQ